MKFYISGALMASKNLNEATKEYEDIAALLEENGHDAYLPHKNTHPEKAKTFKLTKFLVATIPKSKKRMLFLHSPTSLR